MKQKRAGPFEFDETVFARQLFDDPVFIALPGNVDNPGTEAENVGTLELDGTLGGRSLSYSVLHIDMTFRLSVEEAMPWIPTGGKFQDLLCVSSLILKPGEIYRIQ